MNFSPIHRISGIGIGYLKKINSEQYELIEHKGGKLRKLPSRKTLNMDNGRLFIL